MKGLVFPVTPAAQREGWDSGRREQMNGGGRGVIMWRLKPNRTSLSQRERKLV